jgi:hypothetical protein
VGLFSVFARACWLARPKAKQFSFAARIKARIDFTTSAANEAPQKPFRGFRQISKLGERQFLRPLKQAVPLPKNLWIAFSAISSDGRF